MKEDHQTQETLEMKNGQRFCTPHLSELDSNTWKIKRLDSYINEIHDGNKMNVEEYTQSLGLKDFHCGIKKECKLKEDSCIPRSDQDWLLVYSIGQWNTYANDILVAVKKGRKILIGQ
ncbi:hypothetical protein CROQUDRAFT_108232 [Cronartium quercuum f. sp. fusiforme G11]|uniref:Uncharacterized protein n=1 Tax=Cronartium quercuum f. sp. fusiforme G11 TaxID=708437 RepID=A0A9P6NIN6_9BASI|nr:hypothetical protein CROQUDRAFT_108232 [Cronartium quercuum f. sp. fusiforme G11]